MEREDEEGSHHGSMLLCDGSGNSNVGDIDADSWGARTLGDGCWRYEGEGGRHAVFVLPATAATTPTSSDGPAGDADITSAAAAPSTAGFAVLRVRKCDLVRAAALPNESSSGGAHHGNDDDEKAAMLRVKQPPLDPRPLGCPSWEAGQEEGRVANQGAPSLLLLGEDDRTDDVARLNRFLDAIVDDVGDDDDNGNAGKAGDLYREDRRAPSRETEAVRDSAAACPGRPASGRPPEESSVVVGGLSEGYVDRPAGARLSCHLARELRRRALESGRIPPSRLQDWETTTEKQKGDDCDENREDGPHSLPIFGLLLPDYRFLVLRHAESCLNPPSSQGPSVCLEIKPKVGYTSFSPLVSADRRAKYGASRFALLQKLWTHGAVRKSWVAKNASSEGAVANLPRQNPSRYDPLDLFSTDRQRIERALRALLFETPQNNCRLWVDGRPADLGPAPASPSSTPEGELLPNFPRQQAASSSTGQATPGWSREVNRALDLPESASEDDLFVQICADILLAEPLMTQILRLQRLDVLDGDGAIRVYRRLVDGHCGGSWEAAERLVDKYEDACPIRATSERGQPPPPRHDAPHKLLSASPWAAPEDASRIAALCDLVERTLEYLKAREGAQNSPIDQSRTVLLDELHEKAVRVVDELTKDECVYLLRNWLLSLTMNDVSFFLTMTVLGTTAHDEARGTHTSRADGASLPTAAVSRRQTKHAPGIVLLNDAGGVSSAPVRRLLKYQIKVIDCDPKPAKKLREREGKEAPFSLLDGM